jgi:coproporphyrinogen III oxidase-like Fe-S oxidoreductase
VDLPRLSMFNVVRKILTADNYESVEIEHVSSERGDRTRRNIWSRVGHCSLHKIVQLLFS